MYSLALAKSALSTATSHNSVLVSMGCHSYLLVLPIDPIKNPSAYPLKGRTEG